eukprot:920278-Alexandrium_andersonii.AAC.1
MGWSPSGLESRAPTANTSVPRGARVPAARAATRRRSFRKQLATVSGPPACALGQAQTAVYVVSLLHLPASA